MMPEIEALVWCLQHFARLDESNAAIHCAPVRYSPITFRIAHALADYEQQIPDVALVLGHVGAYDLDPGR